MEDLNQQNKVLRNAGATFPSSESPWLLINECKVIILLITPTSISSGFARFNPSSAIRLWMNAPLPFGLCAAGTAGALWEGWDRQRRRISLWRWDGSRSRSHGQPRKALQWGAQGQERTQGERQMCYFVTYGVPGWVSVLCICLSLRKGTMFSLRWTGRTAHAREGERERGDATTPMEDLLFPNHWCLISSILSGTWTSEAGTLQQQQQQLPFHRVGQAFLHVAQCTIFVTWGRVYSDVCFVAKAKKKRKNHWEWHVTLTLFPKS